MDRIALDKDSVRRIDADGRLHVESSHITKACINGYRGSEIPDFEKLGLDPDRIYQLFRDPAELEKAVPTFNNLPILSEHVPVNIFDPQPDKVCGSTGTDAVWNPPYIDNSLVFWTADAIGGINSNKKRELSSAYRYTAIMEPGSFEGIAFDGRMVDIIGNHVATVEIGRAGNDVIVADALPEFDRMKVLSRRALALKSALTAHFLPLLAQDAALPDLRPVLADVTSKTFKADKTKIVAAVTAAFKPVKLAKDADLSGLSKVIDHFDSDTDSEEKEMPTGMDALREMMKGKGATDEEMAAMDSILEGMMEKPKGEDAEVPPGNPDSPQVSKEPMKPGAMDAAIKLAVGKARTDTLAQMNAIRTAEREVRPIVGEIVVAMDSAESVYKFALEHRKIDLTGVAPAAYGPMVRLLLAQPTVTERPRVAMDAAGDEAFYSMFPETKRFARSL